MTEPLLRSKTGGYSLLTLLILIAGAALLIVQAIALTGEAPVDGSAVTRFLPGILGVVFILIFLLGVRNGQVEVFADRIKGKTASGKSYDIAFTEIGDIDTAKRALLLKDPEGKVLLADKGPRYRRLNGLLWLLKAYPEMQADKWGDFNTTEKAPQHQQVRFFLEEDKAVFGDRGFILQVGDGKWFMPVSKAAPLPQQVTHKGQLAVQPKQLIPVPQQDVNPAHIPLEAAWKAMEAAQLPADQLVEIAEKWAAAHGGCALGTNEADELVGEVSDWTVKVST